MWCRQAWIDQHAEAEVISLVKSSVDTYAAKCADRGDKSFHMIYPIMIALCDQGLADA